MSATETTPPAGAPLPGPATFALRNGSKFVRVVKCATTVSARAPEALLELQPADFDFLVYSLRLQTELNLGLLPFGTPGEENPAPDFDLARHNIDLLAMLQQKTRGNLSTEEQRALDNSVTELRFRFVQVQQEESKPE